MIKFKDFYVSDSDYEEQMELFQNEHPNAEFIQITGGHMSPERIWFKYNDELKEQPELSIPKKIAELADKEFNQGDDVLRFGISTTQFGFANEELRFWVTNYGEYDEVATERANILSAYLAGKALGVELVEVK